MTNQGSRTRRTVASVSRISRIGQSQKETASFSGPGKRPSHRMRCQQYDRITVAQPSWKRNSRDSKTVTMNPGRRKRSSVRVEGNYRMPGKSSINGEERQAPGGRLRGQGDRSKCVRAAGIAQPERVPKSNKSITFGEGAQKGQTSHCRKVERGKSKPPWRRESRSQPPKNVKAIGNHGLNTLLCA